MLLSSLSRISVARSTTRTVQLAPSNMVRWMCCGGMHRSPLFIGKEAPKFQCSAMMPDGSQGQVSLSDYQGRYVVLFFYPLNFTFVCPTEITAFSDSVEEFDKLGCSLIAASSESYFSHLSWSKIDRKEGGIGKLNIPVIADKNGLIAKNYNVYDHDNGFPHRGLFVIDGKGILRHITVNDTGVGRSVQEALRIVEAFQYADKHGEVCPANWSRGKRTLDPKNAQSYFKGEN